MALNRREIQLGDVCFDPETGDLRDRSGDRVTLRRKSLEVLKYLAQRPGQIVQKSKVLDAVWPDVTVSEESLTQCIADIRRAIGDQKQRYVTTHVGQGYSLNPEVRDTSSGSSLARPRLVRSAIAIILVAIAAFAFFFSSPTTGELPRIAVLSFDDYSAGDEAGFLSDGMAEGLITELSRYQQIRVIARNSSFAFRDSGLGIVDIAERLDADYVVEGSQQKVGERLRFTVQLIDGHDGTHLWAETYDADIGDLFDVQTDILRAVTNRIGRRITWWPLPGGDRTTVDGLDLYFRGMAEFRKDTRLGTLRARDLFAEAIEMAPETPFGYVGMTWVLWRDLWTNELDAATPRPERLRRAAKLADRALQIDPEFHLAHVVRADIHVAAGELERAAIRYDAAAALNPNDVLVLVASTDALVFLGRAEEAIERIETGIELNPITPDWYFTQLAWAHWSIAECDAGLAALSRAATVPLNALRVEAALHVCAGDIEAAQDSMVRFLEEDPDRTVATEIELFGTSWRDPGTMARWADAMRVAGMPH